MNLITYVDIAEYKLRQAPGLLACRALGSCVGVCLWDYELRLAGLLHILLPSARYSLDRSDPARFADPGISCLVQAMEAQGAARQRLRAKLVGGARMGSDESSGLPLDIGQRNVEAARDILARLDIPILAQHIGGVYGRALKVDAEDFAAQVTVLAHEVVVI